MQIRIFNTSLYYLRGGDFRLQGSVQRHRPHHQHTPDINLLLRRKVRVLSIDDLILIFHSAMTPWLLKLPNTLTNCSRSPTKPTLLLLFHIFSGSRMFPFCVFIINSLFLDRQTASTRTESVCWNACNDPSRSLVFPWMLPPTSTCLLRSWTSICTISTAKTLRYEFQRLNFRTNAFPGAR